MQKRFPIDIAYIQILLWVVPIFMATTTSAQTGHAQKRYSLLQRSLCRYILIIFISTDAHVNEVVYEYYPEC